jgi:hypothetical protein
LDSIPALDSALRDLAVCRRHDFCIREVKLSLLDRFLDLSVRSFDLSVGQANLCLRASDLLPGGLQRGIVTASGLIRMIHFLG